MGGIIILSDICTQRLLLNTISKYIPGGAGMALSRERSPPTIATKGHQRGAASLLAGCQMWIEFVVCSRLAPRVFLSFSGSSSLPPPFVIFIFYFLFFLFIHLFILHYITVLVTLL